MKHVIIVLFFALASGQLPGQSEFRNLSIYNTWVTMYDSRSKIKAVLHSINDSAIVVANPTSGENLLNGNYILTALPIQQTKTLQLRRRGKVATSVAIGAGVGAGIGLLVGKAIGDVDFSLDLYTPSSGHSVSMVAPMVILFGTLGTVAGVIAGSTKVKIPIGGSMNDHKKEELKKYTLEGQLY